MTNLAGFGMAAILLGLALSPVVPIVKRIWTASFTLYSGGIIILALLLFYWMIEVMNWRRNRA